MSNRYVMIPDQRRLALPFEMVKLAISAFLLAQPCTLQVHASHYIQFRLFRNTAISHRTGICLHAGNGIIMTDDDIFGSTAKNFGFHKGKWSANVNWDNKEVDVQGWGRYKFQRTMDDKHRAVFDGCWDFSGGDCSSFKDQSKRDRDRALDY
ncbi:hypothetical protein BGX33_004334 [Mortierella sp. NVP41]|nr:hypothetical protein BGX33_004334 [Mortierella sp. NVP41]